ncbi:vanomycin resistance protein VanB [Luteimicrobium album]|uniref:Vanomycin resistance protein VanB n=1 Tax=Luteimicrobium album TaxID=1054550 RepID=A0ABQ6HW73_9MICO|nr:VanW family protein [Luteimicrobium album]GMA22402.1 vanomycin resistance protein VanB [Luteimicrobium album]
MPVPPGGPTGAPPTDDILRGLGEEPAPGRTGRTLVALGVVVVALVGAYVAAQWFVSDKIAHGTTVAGVEIGGKTVDDAAATLDDRLGDRATEPVAVVAAGKKAQLDPRKAGLTFDARATVDPLVSFTLAPSRLWHAVFGGSEVTPVTRVDTAKLTAALGTVGDAVEVKARNGSVAFSDGAATSVAPRNGTALDRGAARKVVTDGWLTASGALELPTTTVRPEVGADAVQNAMVLAGTVTSSPVDLTVGGQKVRLPGDVLAGAASFVPDGSTLTLKLDAQTLRTDVLARSTKLLTSAQDARFTFTDDKPTIADGKNGTGLDADALAKAVTAAAAKDSGRTATVELTTVEPATTTADLQKLGVTEKVSEFATPLTNEPVRTKNLEVGAAKITGDLVKPGQTFSLVDALSPITTAGGYHEAHVIEGGRLVDGIGGGLSQVATTTYNAAFFAGLDIVTHQPHSYWIPRYPEGREATIAVGLIDMKFANDTPYGVVVQAWLDDAKLHVALWSTKYYTVQTTTSPRTNVVEPSTVHDSSAGCVADAGGQPGFHVSVRRLVSRDGSVVKDETNQWTYKPQDRRVCTSGGGDG